MHNFETWYQWRLRQHLMFEGVGGVLIQALVVRTPLWRRILFSPMMIKTTRVGHILEKPQTNAFGELVGSYVVIARHPDPNPVWALAGDIKERFCCDVNVVLHCPET